MSIPFQVLKDHWQYTFDERIGIMTEGDPPNEAQVAIARQEADEAAQRLKVELENKKAGRLSQI